METALTVSTEAGNAGASGSGGNPTEAGGGKVTDKTAATGLDTSGKSWRDSLPEEIRTNAAISSFKDIESLTKSYIHAQSLVGKKGVVVPGEKAAPEEWQSFYKGIGVPDADKYDVSAPKDSKIPENFLIGFKETAVKNGLLPKQANELLGWYAKIQQADTAQSQKMQKETVTKGIEDLKKEWGDAYDKEISAAQFFVKEQGGPELVQFLNETGAGNNPVIIKTFAKAAKLLGEDKLREGGVSSGGQSPQEIQDELAEVRTALYSMGKDDPMRPIQLRKMEGLAKRLTNGK